MNGGIGPILLALAGAFLLSLGTILQWIGHERHGRSAPEAWRVTAQPLWWAGIGVGAMGTLCYYVALWSGMISLVQPLSSLHIAFTAMGMAWLRKEAILGFRAGTIFLVALGVLCCLVGEVGQEVSSPPELAGSFWFAGVLAAAAAAAFLLPRVADRLSIWAGCAYSVSAVSWKMVSDLGASLHGVAAGMLFGACYVLGFVFMQAAFRRGGAASVNAIATGTATALPLVAAFWIFREPVGWITWLGGGLIVVGVVMGGRRRAPAA